jgi:hypothetical protein
MQIKGGEMTEVNKKFIGAMQKRLDEKEEIFIGELNYKNMDDVQLNTRLYGKWREYIGLMQGSPLHSINDVKKKLVDMANFCWMLWELLEEQ